MSVVEQDTSHHVQQSLCKTRPLYRQGKKLTAVKVYTVTSESQHLYIYGVPKINLRSELKSMCIKYGQIHTIHVVENVETEPFTECYHVMYQRIQSARIAKRFLDNKSFYGGILHVCYTPEHETLDQLKYKLEQRRYEVLNKLHGGQLTKPNFKEVTQDLLNITTKVADKQGNISRIINRKRKRPAVEITEESMAGVDPMLVWKDIPKDLDPRIKTDSLGSSMPKKHYKIIKSQDSNGEDKVKIQIKTNAVYGPQLPTNTDLNQVQGEINPVFNRLLVPTQVVLSKEYIYRHKKNNADTKILFRNKAGQS